jgi:excisionase family DNA binding protein
METATSLTLSQAAHATNVPNSTIWRSIKSGRLSASRDDAGTYRIEASELFKCFPSVAANTEAAAPWKGRNVEASELQQAHQRAREAEIEASHLRARLDDMTEERNRWQAIAERLSQQPQSLWKWLRSGLTLSSH